jgi:RNA polymerase sigma factor (sigma-70 family)
MPTNEAERRIGEGILRHKNSLPEQAKRDVEKHLASYQRLIYKMARKYVRNRVEFDDLIQEALYGLMLACRDFDPSRSDKKMYEYCIGNESPIYIPTQVAKAASYVKQMQRLLDREPYLFDKAGSIEEIISTEKHVEEENINPAAAADLKELKRKLGNIANNSKTAYSQLARLAMESLSMIVSDEVLAKCPKETDLVEDIVANQEVVDQLRETLGEKKYTVISMRAEGWNLRQISEELEKLGYVNKQGGRITRQAVKAILGETLQAVKKMKNFKYLDVKEGDEREPIENEEV